MPPFGPEWFRAIEEGSPLGLLREAWIYRNMEQDAHDEFERQQSITDMQGFYANPELYFKLRDLREGKAPSSSTIGGTFRVEYDTSDFNRRLQGALKGEDTQKPQNEEIASWIKDRRAKHTPQSDPRMVAVPNQEEQFDTVEVEYAAKKNPEDG